MLIHDPEVGNVVSGTGGLRKTRFAPVGTGKSGGVRVCYAHFPGHGMVLLAAAYGKGQKADLTPAEKRYFKHLLGMYQVWLDEN